MDFNDCTMANFTSTSYLSSDTPGAPEAPTVTDIFKDHCTVAWQPPVEDGGTPIIGYHLERAMAGSSRWLKVNKEIIVELTCTEKDLIEGNEYQYRVIAENKVGVGPPSEPCKPFTAKDPWGEWRILV